MNNYVITPLTISDLSGPDLKFFTRLGIISPSALEGLKHAQPSRRLKRDKVLGLVTMIGVSAAGWTAFAVGIVRLLK